MRSIKIIFFLIGLASILFSVRCTYNKWPESPVSHDTVSFNKQIIPIFTQFCATSRCHNADYINNNVPIDLDSNMAYNQLTGSNSVFVYPYAPNTSILYIEVQENVMPLYLPSLSFIQKQEIYNWIQQGAKNN